MVGLQYLGRLSGGSAPFSVGITDLEIATIGGRLQLYSTNRPGAGGIGAYDISVMAAPALLSQQGFRPGMDHLTTPQLAVLQDGAAPFILPAGMGQSHAAAYMLDGDGSIGSQVRFAVQDTPPADMIAVTQVWAGGQAFIVAARAGRAGPFVYEMGANRNMQPLSSAQGHVSGPDLTVLETLRLGGADLVLAASPAGNHLTSYRVDGAGRIVQADRLDSLASGLGFDTPTALATAVVGGAGYAILAGAGSSSLTVLRIGADGRMQPVEHVIDTLDTRFHRVAAVETFVLGDRVFVLAGGADDGLSLFALLPDGRLIHLSALADTADTALANVTAIAATGAGGAARIFAASESETGISRFTLDIGAIGATLQGGTGERQGTGDADLLIAGPGTAGLSGGGGNDMLVAGTGALQMRGGAGRDHFVAAHNGRTLTVLDYEPGTDRLDLSLFPMLRGIGQLQIAQTAQGARIVFGNTTIELRSANGRPIDPARFTDGELLGLTRYVPPAPPAMVMGTAADNRLILGDEGGTVYGMEGDDTITGGRGDAFIGGGPGNDWIRMEGGQNRIWGGTGSDTILGGADDDEIHGGGAGANHLYGNAGNDTVTGGDGPDLIAGGAGDDALYLGLGDDFAGGGAGDDLIVGGTGCNTIYTGLGRDTVEGGSGNDVILGAGGANRLFGHDGQDWISGGEVGDLIAGGAEDDVLLGNGGNDSIYAGLGNDFIGGGAGDDLIVAGAGHSRVYGGAGNDTIHAGTGRDMMTGGPGADTFVFATPAQLGIGAARDTITDFQPGIDRIDLSALNLTFIGAGAFRGRPGDLALVREVAVGDTDGDGIADFAIELSGALDLSAGDFIL